MSRVVDITGQRFTRLLVLSRAESSKRGQARWLCLCDCGNQIVAIGKDIRRGHTGSCGCLQVDRTKKAPIALRFWDRVEVAGLGDCWNWTGSVGIHNGYGYVTVARQSLLAHRVAWSLHHGYDSEECVLHRCDNRLCCNPAHLFEGSYADNHDDMTLKGRRRNGATGPMTLAEELATRGNYPCTP